MAKKSPAAHQAPPYRPGGGARKTSWKHAHDRGRAGQGLGRQFGFDRPDLPGVRGRRPGTASALRRPGYARCRPGRRSRRGGGVRCATTPAPPGTPARPPARGGPRGRRGCAPAGRPPAVMPGTGARSRSSRHRSASTTRGRGTGCRHRRSRRAATGPNPPQPVRAYVQGGGGQIVGCPVLVGAQHQAGDVPAGELDRPGVRPPGGGGRHGTTFIPVPIAAGPERSFSGRCRQFPATGAGAAAGDRSGQPEYGSKLAGHGIYIVQMRTACSDTPGLAWMVTDHRSCSCWGPGPIAQGPQVRSRAASEDVSQVQAWPQRVQVIVTGCGISGSVTGIRAPVRAGAVPGLALFPLGQH